MVLNVNDDAKSMAPRVVGEVQLPIYIFRSVRGYYT